ncbi:putative major facilitator superfamily transporter protein [Eutypa lata UCREL1]|uniref:Putative major facilitator superfamily transporter protein n=1 Tax=Eutypa lata (strain UCR-EL1) TaxID=1287681 RepID=M7TEE4_EUTLA|nr:putative major facilitator superfamily transporter protein [Eutypa lata UCREL1]
MLLPWLCILYLLAFLDRTNIGNAKIAGLPADTHLVGDQYNITLTVFFIPYALCLEPVTNVLLKKWRPSVFIPTIMILWGASMTGMGFCHNFGGLATARFFLGLAECGLFPGVNYYLSCWYKRSEFGVRAAIFFSAAALAGSFGGLLAAGIEHMDGVGNLEGWRWIFILEGLLTIVFGVISFWMVYDFPAEARFLSDEDRNRVIRRLWADQQSLADNEDWNMEHVRAALKDWKMWLGMLVYAGCLMPVYAFSLFLPTIVQGLGITHDPVKAQLLTVPPYAVGAILTVVVGFIADKTQQRGIWNILISCLGITGFAMLLGSKNPAVQYVGTFLGAAGIYPCIANTITWMANNVEGVYKRGVVLGFVIGWGNLNGIVSSNIYRNAPRFLEGHGIVLAYLVVFLLGGSVLMTLLLRAENKKRREGKRNCWAEGKEHDELAALGDQRPDFYYTL